MNIRALTVARPAENHGGQDANYAQHLMLGSRSRTSLTASRVFAYALRLIVVACLAIDAYVHVHLAHNYDPIRASVSQGTLFRYEAAAAIVAGAILLITGRTFAWILAFLVLAAGFAAVMVYQYVDVGAFGPFPEMYDPYWTFEKGLSLVAEGLGTVLAGAVVATRLRTWWGSRDRVANS